MPFKKQSGTLPVVFVIHFVALMYWQLFSPWTLVVFFVMQFGVHAGYHRWCSHRSYDPSRVVGFLICVMGVLSLQYGPIWWASHHGTHHSNCETEDDPHTPNKGRLHAHVGWLWREG